jgi:hypothetical protein
VILLPKGHKRKHILFELRENITDGTEDGNFQTSAVKMNDGLPHPVNPLNFIIPQHYGSYHCIGTVWGTDNSKVLTKLSIIAVTKVTLVTFEAR